MNVPWSGEQVKEQKNDLKLFRHAGHVERKFSTMSNRSRRVSTCFWVQQIGPSAKAEPQTSIRSVRWAVAGNIAGGVI